MSIKVLRLCVLVMSLIVAAATFAEAATCKEMASLRLPNTTIALAEAIDAGPSNPRPRLPRCLGCRQGTIDSRNSAESSAR